MTRKHKLTGKPLAGDYKTSKPKPIKEKRPTPGKIKPYHGIALRTCTAHLCGKDYSFEIGKEYEIIEQEAWIKLTNPISPILREKK